MTDGSLHIYGAHHLTLNTYVFLPKKKKAFKILSTKYFEMFSLLLLAVVLFCVRGIGGDCTFHYRAVICPSLAFPLCPGCYLDVLCVFVMGVLGRTYK